MTGAVAEPQAQAARGFWHNPKLELWIVWWSMPIFYNIFVLAFFVLAKNQPPPPAYFNVPQILEWLNTVPPDLLLGDMLWIVAIGFPAWHIGLIAVLLNYMSVSKAFGYAYIGIMAAAALPGGVLFTYGYSLIALRPDRAAMATEFLYDFGNLTFMGSMGVFFLGSLVLVIAIMLDKNKILPKWFGYACIWNLTTEFTVAPVWIFRDGPFAWDGEVSYYWNMVIYGTWQFMYIYVFYKAIRKLPPRPRARHPRARTPLAQGAAS
jgi:hypothetical protein